MTVGRFAPFYRWVEYAAFGRALERSRFVFLDRLARARNILIAGEGDGRTLAYLLRAAPLARIDVLEISASMIELARRRAAYSPRVRFLHADARACGLGDGRYDGIVAPFFFDCFSENELRELIHMMQRAAAGGAVWIVTDFVLPASGWRRWHAAAWVVSMYRFFAVVTGLRAKKLPPIEALLTGAGLRSLECREQRWGLIRAQVWAGGIERR